MRSVLLVVLLLCAIEAKEQLFVVEREFSTLAVVENGKQIGLVEDMRNLNHGVVKFDGKDGYLISRDGYVIKFDPKTRKKQKEYQTSKSAIGFIVEPHYLVVANYDDKTVEILSRDLKPIQKIATGSKNVGIKNFKNKIVFALMDKDELWVMENKKSESKPQFELLHKIENAGVAPFDAMIRGSEYVVGFFGSPFFGVLDVESGKYRQIAVGSGSKDPVLKVPHFGFWSIAKDRIFVPAVGEAKMHVFDPSFERVGEVGLAGNPVFTSLSPDEKLMAVTFSGKDFPILQIVDTKTLKIIKTIRFDGSVLHVRWSLEKPHLYVADNTTHKLITLDTKSFEEIGEVSIRTPSGIFIYKE